MKARCLSSSSLRGITQGMLEALSKPELDILILDRGIFDALVWTDWLAQTGKIVEEEREACDRFFAMSRWVDLVDLVFVMTCDPTLSIEREYSDQLTTKRGNIMSDDTLRQLSRSISATKAQHASRFRHSSKLIPLTRSYRRQQ